MFLVGLKMEMKLKSSHYSDPSSSVPHSSDPSDTSLPHSSDPSSSDPSSDSSPSQVGTSLTTQVQKSPV